MKNLEFFIRLLEKYYYRKTGLIIGYIFLLFIIKFFNPDLAAILPDQTQRILIYVLVYIIWSFIWLISKSYYPRIKKDKIGIVVAINAENEKQKTRIKVDFTKRLKENLKVNNISHLFEILVLNDYKSESVLKIIETNMENHREFVRLNENDPSNQTFEDNRQFKKIRSRIKGHFYIWGTIIERHENENKYILNINGLVVHTPISTSKSKNIAKQFISIFPKEISFYEKFEISGFRFTADTVYVASRYITGLAALYSGDPITASKLHSGLKNEIVRLFTPLPQHLANVCCNIERMILFEDHLLAKFEYFINKNPEKSKRILNKCLNKFPNDYESLMLLSYISFEHDKNPIKTLKLINKASKYCKTDYTWLYNKAFVLMYLDKYENALKLYRRIEKISFRNEDKIVDECLDFGYNLIKNESDKIQIHFVLGFIYSIKKSNNPMALEHFEKFKKLGAKNIKYKPLLNSTNTFINEIKKEMNL